MASLFELQIIESLIPLFDAKAEATDRGIENWAFKTLYVWLHPQPFPRFRHFIFILKSRTNLHVKNKQIKNSFVNIVVVSIINQLILV